MNSNNNSILKSYCGLYFFLAVWIISSCNQKQTEKIMVTGYNSSGQLVTKPGQSRNQVCQQTLSDFDRICGEQGNSSIYAENCEILCSAPVTPQP